MKGKIVLWVLGGFIVLALLIGGIWAFRYYTAGVRGVIGAQEQIQSAPSRIANYNHFFDLCASVQGAEAALDAQYAQLAATQDPKEQARILSNIAGISAQRERSMRQYNADARKDYTAGQFRDSDLPYQLSVTEYKKGARTSCGN